MDAQTTNGSHSTLREDGVYAVLGLVVVAAIHADGRAHILGLPDSFFSPWHAFLYGGLALVVGWLVVMSSLVARRSRGIAVIPAGYGAAAAGAVVFGAGGVADMVWHLIFGIEFGIDALLSPSHLLLFVGGGLLLSGPLLAARRRGSAGLPANIPPLLSVVGITGVVAFALSYLSAFLSEAPAMPITREPEGTAAHFAAESMASSGLASFLVSSLVLVVPAVVLLRRRLWFPGALSVLITAVALLASSLAGFGNPEIIPAAFLSGVVLDVLVAILRRAGAAPALLEAVIAAGVPLLVWSGQLIARSIRQPLGWSEEMTSGVVLLSAILTLVAVMVLGGRLPDRQNGAEGEDPAVAAPVPAARGDR